MQTKHRVLGLLICLALARGVTLTSAQDGLGISGADEEPMLVGMHGFRLAHVQDSAVEHHVSRMLLDQGSDVTAGWLITLDQVHEEYDGTGSFSWSRLIGGTWNQHTRGWKRTSSEAVQVNNSTMRHDFRYTMRDVDAGNAPWSWRGETWWTDVTVPASASLLWDSVERPIALTVRVAPRLVGWRFAPRHQPGSDHSSKQGRDAHQAGLHQQQQWPGHTLKACFTIEGLGMDTPPGIVNAACDNDSTAVCEVALWPGPSIDEILAGSEMLDDRKSSERMGPIQVRFGRRLSINNVVRQSVQYQWNSFYSSYGGVGARVCASLPAPKGNGQATDIQLPYVYVTVFQGISAFAAATSPASLSSWSRLVNMLWSTVSPLAIALVLVTTLGLAKLKSYAWHRQTAACRVSRIRTRQPVTL